MEVIENISMKGIIGGLGGVGDGPPATIDYGDTDDFYTMSDNGNGTYMVDSTTYTSVSGDSYSKVSFDGGQTWQNEAASDFANADVAQMNQNLGNYANLAALGAYASNNAQAIDAFSTLSYATQGLGVALDANQMYNYYNSNEGDMDGIRFSIRTMGTATSIIAASAYGGPEGVIVGTLVGGLAQGGEFAYDTATQALNAVWGQFMNNYSNGWLPQAQ